MRIACHDAGKAFKPFALGGQDSDSADYLISNAEGFALINLIENHPALFEEGLS